MLVFEGSCHCGAVQFRIETEFTEFTKCDCTLCRKKNAVMTPVHESQFTLIAGEGQLGCYQWNMRIAKHYFCKQCGIYTFHRKRAAPDTYGVNVYCLDNVDINAVSIIEVDGKSMSLLSDDG